MDRNETISKIKAALKRRSGRPWSVTGGRGTSWGWITIDTPPAKRTRRWRLKPGLPDWPENYEEYDSGQPGGSMTAEDAKLLADLLGFDRPVHFQGCSIPASHDHWREYLDRAEGRKPAKIAEQYWD